MGEIATLLFELGRFTALAGGLSLGVFLIAYLRYRRALARLDSDMPDDDIPLSLTDTVSYLRRQGYVDTPHANLSERYRAPVVWPFQLGVWLFCAGMVLMSLTLGFVLVP